jgi:hypothetical protein
MLSALGRQRALRVELGAIAAEQAALRQMAALAAGGGPSGAVFAAVAVEAGHVLPESALVRLGGTRPQAAHRPPGTVRVDVRRLYMLAVEALEPVT